MSEVSGSQWNELYSAHIEEWSERVAAACGERRIDGVVIFSGTEKRRFRDDNDYPFYAEPYFKAWVPLDVPDAALKILPGNKPVLVYLRSVDFWQAPPEEPAGYWTDHIEIRSVADLSSLHAELGQPTAGLAAIGEAASPDMGFASANDPALLANLDFQRARKTPYEVACIEAANRIAAAGHAATRHALMAAPHEQSEFRLNQTYCSVTQQRESELPYQNIVALNEHASTLHYQHLDREPPEELRSFLLDAGAQYNGYASDITRTLARADGQFAALIKSLDAMQKRLCAGSRNGVGFASLNDFAHQLLAQTLVEHGLMTCDAGQGYERGITRAFLPHGLGHLLGLQVHDAGGHLAAPDGSRCDPPEEHPFLRLTRTLEPGFVVTIEPGIYFIPSLLERLRSSPEGRLIDWPRVEALLPYGGIRIEDDVLVTATDSRNLSRPALATHGVT